MYGDKWLIDRMNKRMRVELKTHHIYTSSNTSSPNVYKNYLEKYGKSRRSDASEPLFTDMSNDSAISSGPADSSPNYLPLKGRDTPGDRHEEPKSHIRELEQEVNKEATTTNGVNDIDRTNENIPDGDDTSDEEYGPRPLQMIKSLNKRVRYGNELLPGEGDAIAQYVQEGKRIPRRGEVGLTSEQIENFERIGYVMSGSRHKAMTAMRLKKEALVYNAENERAKALKSYENHVNNENAIINNLKNILRKQQ